MQTMKDWHKSHPHLFVKSPRNHAGRDIYPDAVSDDAVRAAVGFAASLGAALHFTTFAVNIPQMRSPLDGLVLDVPGMVRVAEKRSRAECAALRMLCRRRDLRLFLNWTSARSFWVQHLTRPPTRRDTITCPCFLGLAIASRHRT